MRNNIAQILSKNEIPKVDEKVKRKNIQALKIEILSTNICKKEKFINMLINQVLYINKIIFVIQFLLLIVGIGIIKMTDFRDTNILITFVVAILSAFQFIEIEKSFKYKMYEIEMSSKIDLRMLISLRTIILSAINLCIMTVFGIIMGIKFEYEISIMILHFLVPFLIINLVNIEIAKRFKTNEIIKIFLSLGISTLLLIVHIQEPMIYEKSSMAIWLITLFVSIVVLIKNWYELWDKEEEFIWNLR